VRLKLKKHRLRCFEFSSNNEKIPDQFIFFHLAVDKNYYSVISDYQSVKTVSRGNLGIKSLIGLQGKVFLLKFFSSSLTERNRKRRDKMKKKVLMVVLLWLFTLSVLIGVLYLKSRVPDYKILLEPVNNQTYGYTVFPAEGLERLFEKIREDGKITEKKLSELTEITHNHPHLRSDVIIAPIRAFPLWGSDLRVDYFTKDANCDPKETVCEIFHAVRNVHYFSMYRFEPSPADHDWLQPDFLDFCLSLVAALFFCYVVNYVAVLRFSL